MKLGGIRMWEIFKKKKNPHLSQKESELLSIMDRLEKKVVTVDFDVLTFPVEFIGSKSFQPVKGDFCSGEIMWRNDGFSDRSISFRNIWSAGSWIDWHKHENENEHLFLTKGELVMKVGTRGEYDEYRLDNQNPYLKIPMGVAHEAISATDCEFIVMFEPWINEK